MRYSGYVGFQKTEQTSPGIWENINIRRKYNGEIIRRVYRNNYSANSDVVIRQELSVIADHYILDNVDTILYAEYKNKKWAVTDFDVKPPRINLTLGGLYNEQ